MGNAEYMGAQLASAHSALNMKLLVVLALAAIAAAEPEAEAKAAADPYLYGYGGYGLGYGYGLGGYYGGYGLGYYGKREAEAEPKAAADPYLSATAAMGWDTYTEDTTVDTVLATTESVRLRLSPRLLLILGNTVDTDSGLMDLDTDTVDSTTVDSTTESK